MKTTKKLITDLTTSKRVNRIIPFEFKYSALINRVVFDTDDRNQVWATIQNDHSAEMIGTAYSKKEFINVVYEYLNEENN